MKSISKLMLIMIFIFSASGCAFNSSVGAGKDLKFDVSRSLKKFEGVYENNSQITSRIWPENNHAVSSSYAEAIEVRFKPPKFLIVKAY